MRGASRTSAPLVANQLMATDGTRYLNLALTATPGHVPPTHTADAARALSGGWPPIVLGDDEVTSAVAILLPASGLPIGGTAANMAADVQGHAPPAGAAWTATCAFSAMGSQVCPVVGVSVSVTDPAAPFAGTFGLEPGEPARGRIEANADAGVTTEAPLGNLAPEAADFLTGVTFPPPRGSDTTNHNW